jgi:SAM-dependent methyltransferase
VQSGQSRPVNDPLPPVRVKGIRIVDLFERALGRIDGGRVLDVATQEGGFVQILIDHLKNYTEIVGIDVDGRAIETAQQTLGRANVRFQVMNAERLDFEDGSFDTVSISASLHHLSHISRVLEEMVRILKPGGHLILAEMHRDGQTEAELTSVYLHHWVAEVDVALGGLHRPTLTRQELADYARVGLSHIALYDRADRDSDPMQADRIEQLEGLIESTIRRTEGTSHCQAVVERGAQLRSRLYQVGAQREPILVIVGIK